MDKVADMDVVGDMDGCRGGGTGWGIGDMAYFLKREG